MAMASRAVPGQWLFLRPRSLHSARPHLQKQLQAQAHNLLAQTPAQARTISKPARARTARPPKQPTPPTKPKPQPQPQQTNTYLSAEDSYKLNLLARGAETTLYSAPASPIYPLTCRSIGTFCLAYAAFNGSDALFSDHPGLWAGIPMMIGGVCIVMAASGAWIFASGTRLINRLVAVPSTSASGAQTLLLRLEGRALTPLLPARTVTLPFADARLAARPAEVRNAGLLGGTARTQAGMRAQMAESGAADAEADGGNVLARAVGRLLGTFRRVVGREGILPVYTRAGEGAAWRTWKMDVRDGALLEDGASLERLVRIRRL